MKATPKKTDLTEIDEKCAAYATLGDQIKGIASQRDDVRAEVEAALRRHGVKNKKGDVVLDLLHFTAEHRRRVSTKLNEEAARKLLKSKGLLKRVEKTETTTYLDEDAILALFNDGKITKDELKGMTSSEESVAFFVVPKKRTP